MSAEQAITTKTTTTYGKGGKRTETVEVMNVDAPKPQPKFGVDALPKQAKRTWRETEAASETRRVKRAALEAQRSDAKLRVVRADNRLRSNLEQQHPSKAEKADATADRVEALEDVAEIEARIAAHDKEPNPPIGILNEWRDSGINRHKWKMKNHPLPMRKDGETHAEAMDKIAERHADLFAEFNSVKKAPADEADQLAEARSLFADISARMEPVYASVRGVDFDMRGNPRSRSFKIPEHRIATERSVFIIPDLGMLVVDLLKDELLPLLEKKLQSRHKAIGKKSIPVADRKKMLAEIEAQMLDLQRDSEAVYRDSVKAGTASGRRIANSPLAILDIEAA